MKFKHLPPQHEKPDYDMLAVRVLCALLSLGVTKFLIGGKKIIYNISKGIMRQYGQTWQKNFEIMHVALHVVEIFQLLNKCVCQLSMCFILISSRNSLSISDKS